MLPLVLARIFQAWALGRAGVPRIGFLAYGLDRPLSGVSRVVLELGRELARTPGCEIVYLRTHRRGRRLPSAPSIYLPGCSRLPGLMALGGPLISAAARRCKLDLVHDPSGISPFTLGRRAAPYKRVVTLYDAIAFRYPQGYPWLNNLLHRRYAPSTLAHVDAVITASNHARQDLARFLQLPRRQFVVPCGVGPSFRAPTIAASQGVAERFGLTGPFILSVGAQQARKNLGALLEAFALVRAAHPEYRLAIAGPTLWRHQGIRDQVAALGLERAVACLGFVPDSDLPALYGAASLFAFPSLYEGFGLPVLEAMACGTPVVCSNTSSLPEVAADAALLVDPTRPDELAAAMLQIIEDQDLHGALRERGLTRARDFTWERSARETVEVYRQVLAERR